LVLLYVRHGGRGHQVSAILLNILVFAIYYDKLMLVLELQCKELELAILLRKEGIYFVL